MTEFALDRDPHAWGSWRDAEALRRWSFARRTPAQRLAWLVEMLEIAYSRGAIRSERSSAQFAACGVAAAKVPVT